MISMTLFKKEIKSGYKILLIFMGVLTLYASMIVSMFDPALGQSLNEMAASMPDMFAAFGMLNAGTTLIEFLANYLYGFLLIVLPAVYIIILSSRLVVRYVDKGSMVYLVATPNKRLKIILTQISIMVLNIILLVAYVTIVCIFVSGSMFQGELDTGKFLILNIGLLGILVFLSGLCFMCSAVFNLSRYATGIASALIIYFILAQMVSQVGDKYEAVKYATPLTLFNPEGIISGEASAFAGFMILYAAGVIFYTVGAAVFCKKDLPI